MRRHIGEDLNLWRTNPHLPASGDCCNGEKSGPTGEMARSEVAYRRLRAELIGAFRKVDGGGCTSRESLGFDLTRQPDGGSLFWQGSEETSARQIQQSGPIVAIEGRARHKYS